MALKINFNKILGFGEKLGFRNSRPPLEPYYIYVLLFFIGWLIADLATTSIRAQMLPVGGITQVKTLNSRIDQNKNQASVFSSVKDKNIFNSDHFIPESLGDKKSGGGFEDNSLPVPTTLPLELVGTIIHGRHEMSVATIQIRGGDIQAVKEEEELGDMAKIHEIGRHRVVFRNLKNRKLEFIEIKEENKITMGVATNKSVVNASEAIKTNFTFKRTEINQYLENLPQVLQDAKAVPYITPGSGGEVSGFKLVAIKEGSIYEKLGLVRGDIIKGVNGEPVDSPQKAMELYQALKSSDEIKLDISRDGSSTTLNYNLE
jgi:general secretion pathway protein C